MLKFAFTGSKVHTANKLLKEAGMEGMTQGQISNSLSVSGGYARAVVSNLRKKGAGIILKKGGFDAQGRQRKSRYISMADSKAGRVNKSYKTKPLNIAGYQKVSAA